MGYWTSWHRQHEEFRRQVRGFRTQLQRDAEFFDGHVLYVSEMRFAHPFGDEPPPGFLVLGIGLGGRSGSLKCTSEAHVAWLAAGVEYLDTIEAATDRAAAARNRHDEECELLGNRILRWRLRVVEQALAQAMDAYRAEVAAAEEAYRPTREAIAASVAQLTEERALADAEERARTEERRGKARELAALPLWGLLVTGKGRAAEVIIHRHDIAPLSSLPTDTEPHPWEEAEPLTGLSLEPAVRQLRENGATVRWEGAATAAVEEEFGFPLATWWEDLFPRSDLFRPPKPRTSPTTYTGIGHHSSYGGGHFSCASSH